MNQAEFNQYYLRSEKGIDYRQLRDLLAAGNWQAADAETTKIVCQCLGCSDIQSASLIDFPCTDLISMDRLWMAYSQRKFGFSIQVQFYLQCLQVCVRSGRKAKVKSVFLGSLRWSLGGIPVSSDSITIFPGHFPSVFLRLYQESDDDFIDFFHRFFSCSVAPPRSNPPLTSQD